MKYRKKPIIIEAVQYDGTIESVLPLGMEEITTYLVSSDLYIETPEGIMTASPGCYIVKGIRGEFYPVKEDIFLESYEKVTE